ncbi:hypothetical protein ACOMHN_033937 [Nucella lapillus]
MLLEHNQAASAVRVSNMAAIKVHSSSELRDATHAVSLDSSLKKNNQIPKPHKSSEALDDRFGGPMQDNPRTKHVQEAVVKKMKKHRQSVPPGAAGPRSPAHQDADYANEGAASAIANTLRQLLTCFANPASRRLTAPVVGPSWHYIAFDTAALDGKLGQGREGFFYGRERGGVRDGEEGRVEEKRGGVLMLSPHWTM